MNKLKYHFLWWLVFLGTVLFWYIWYTAYTNLATQVDWATITKDIWNDVINTVNSIWAKTDWIYSSWWSIWIWTSLPNSKLDVSWNVTTTWDWNIGWSIIYRVWPANTDVRVIARISPDSWRQWDYEILTMNRTTWAEYNRTMYAYDWTWYFPKAINQSSDIRLKKDICSIKNWTDIVNKLRWVTFERKDNSSGTGSQYWFIAQEVEKVLPDLVKTDSKWYKSVNYDWVIPVLVKAVQEQNSKLENQQKQIDKLNEKLEKLINYWK